MNQILYTIENEEEKNRMKNITLFFGIVIIIFGILLVLTGGYSFAVANAEKQQAIEETKVPSLDLSFENNKVIIKVTHSKELEKLEYTWNEEKTVVLDEAGQQNITETINVPAGKNTLKVKVTDVKGKTTSTVKEVSYEGTYMDLSVVDNKSLKIVITDVKGLQSATYKWNSGEETTAYPNETNPTVIEIVSNIPIGLNTIEINATNKANEVQTKEMQVQGITKPTISIDYDDARTTINIKFKDDQGIQSYSYKVSNAPLDKIIKNGKLIENAQEKLTQVVSETKEGNGEKEITQQLTFNEGFNYIEVTITNVEGAEEKFSGWCAK